MPAKPNTFIGEALPMQKRSFVRTGEEKIASYDWTDIANGIGYVTFILTTTADSTGEKLLLVPYTLRTPRQIYQSSYLVLSTSGTYVRSGNITSDSFQKVIEKSFYTSEFNSPRIVYGNIIFQLASVMMAWSNWDRCESYYVAKIYKVGSTGETLILTSTSETKTDLKGSFLIPNYFTWFGFINKTNFKRGEKIKVTIEGYLRRVGSSNQVAMMFAYDPLDKEIPPINDANASNYLRLSAGETKSTISIPFRIDL